MTDYTKLVEALRCCATCDCDSEKCKYIGLGMDEDVSCIMAITKDAADAIEALQAKVNRLELDNEDYEHEHRRLKGEIEALQAENPIVETVLVDKLRQRIDELEEKQTYCDAYGNKWMTSGKDVPTEAYKHGYADGRDEAQKQIDSIENDKTNLEADIINLEIALDKVNTQLPKRGKWIYKPKDAIEMMFTLPKCSVCGHESSDANNYCPRCGANMEVQDG